jgi:osmoprotectant transport system permease protein
MRVFILLLSLCCLLIAANAQTVRVGSKRFTESYVLGEIARQLLERAGLQVEHKQGMGNTAILWEALKSGAIDAYPEYTGTITEAILKTGSMSLEQIRDALEEQRIGITGELGFNNTYALCMRREKAQQLGITRISDLQHHPGLRIGLTHEFLDRADGWRPLSRKYGLQMTDVRGIDHAIGYVALKNDEIDIKDAYSTDAKIAEYDLIVLEDDLGFFPQYKAVFLYRESIPPQALRALRELEGTLPADRMIKLNAEAERTKDYTLAASLYFGAEARQEAALSTESLSAKIARWTLRHLTLVGISMLFAVLVGIPLGIAASKPGWWSKFILSLTGVVQTVPSLALLAMLVPVPFLGISPATAVVALFLYSLLPIVRNTASGLQDIPAPLRESASALGLEPSAQLRKVFLPLASRSILAGVKTSAVINVGTATLAALIGAGGLGEPIISGLSLNDNVTILQGAVPAALLALLVQWGFDGVDRLLIPKGLRLMEKPGMKDASPPRHREHRERQKR